MKKLIAGCLIVSGVAVSLSAAPFKVAVLDFDFDGAQQADLQLGGALDTEAFADKGAMMISRELLREEAYTLIDRRAFLQQIDESVSLDDGRVTAARPTFLQAAQHLNADAVLRGSVLSLSTGKEVVRQGGYETDFTTLSLRVLVEALDVRDGTIIAMGEGVAREKIRQTEAVQRFVSEDDLLDMMEKALSQTVQSLTEGLNSYRNRLADRPRVSLSVTTTADPALVEIDGMLVGSTPLENYQVFKGDHVITVGKAGHRDVTKRILIETDMQLEIPVFRAELTADELKDVLDKMRINAYIGAEPALIIEQQIDQR